MKRYGLVGMAALTLASATLIPATADARTKTIVKYGAIGVGLSLLSGGGSRPPSDELVLPIHRPYYLMPPAPVYHQPNYAYQHTPGTNGRPGYTTLYTRY